MTKEIKDIYYNAIYLIVLVNGLIWLRSSWGKLTEGKFVGGLAGTLTKFASNNPYPWFKNLLQTVAIPNASTIGLLIMFSEAFIAVALTGGALYYLFAKKINPTVGLLFKLGLVGGSLLNLIFWLAAGWTSPSTDGLNLVMLATQSIILALSLGILR